MGSDSGSSSSDTDKNQVNPSNPKSGQWDETRGRSLGYNDFIGGGMYGPSRGETKGAKPDFAARRDDWNAHNPDIADATFGNASGPKGWDARAERARDIRQGVLQAAKIVPQSLLNSERVKKAQPDLNIAGFAPFAKYTKQTPAQSPKSVEAIKDEDLYDWDSSWLGQDVKPEKEAAVQTPTNTLGSITPNAQAKPDGLKGLGMSRGAIQSPLSRAPAQIPSGVVNTDQQMANIRAQEAAKEKTQKAQAKQQAQQAKTQRQNALDYETAAWGTQRNLAPSTPKAPQPSQANVQSRSLLDDVSLIGRVGLQKAGGPVLDLGISLVETLGSPLNLGMNWAVERNARNYLDGLVSKKEKSSMAAYIGSFLGDATSVGIDIGTFGATAVGSAAGKSWSKGHHQNWSREKQNKDLGYELGMGYITSRLGSTIGLLGKGTNLLSKNEVLSWGSEKALAQFSAASAKYGIDLLADREEDKTDLK